MDLLEQKLSRIDLNLLVSLSVLLKEKNVSRAAEKMYLSQSAMSRTLQRLRDLFDDPLFHRTASGIIPTEKALQLELLLPDLLQKLETILQKDNFSAISCDKSFAISIPTLMSHAIFLPLLQEVTSSAPLVQLTEFPAQANPSNRLERGELDFALHITPPADPAFTATHFGSIAPVIFARKEHPLAKKKKITLADCAKYRFLDLILDGDLYMGFVNPADTLLFAQGIRRDIQLKSSQLSILVEMLKSTDTLLIGPDIFLNTPEHKKHLVPLYTFEKDLVDLYLIAHRRTENSKAHQWLKNKILLQKLQ